MGNGYAVTAVIGKRKVMEVAQKTFISSTFWTERIGSAAALKTLEIMDREKSWQVITKTGNKIRERWRQLAIKKGLEISLTGIPAISGFSIGGTRSRTYKTLITQEMLSRGYLASTSVFVCIEHTDEILQGYLMPPRRHFC